jgi:phosphatidylserine/phosphatidylglycerophosphate/cardiolipin synthase-like enzyme
VTTIVAYANCDHVLVIWRPRSFGATSRGFALFRQYLDDQGQPAGDEHALENWTGWEGDKVPRGTFKPSTEWPIQRLVWADLFVEPRRPVRYRVAPMNGKKGALTQGRASEWTEPVAVSPKAEAGFEAYFNRGIVASQWLTDALGDADPATKLRQSIGEVGNKVRNDLSGRLRAAMVDLLEQALDDGVEVYAALFELDDRELIGRLVALGKRAHVVLANGAAGADHKARDENADAADKLSGVVDLHRRMVDQRKYLAHNKFLVVCDKGGAPSVVWTGSTNWTMTGLCTQVNNGILIRSKPLARAFHKRWDDLRQAGDAPPPTLADGVVTAKAKVSGAQVTAWFAPVNDFVDLVDARRHIAEAEQGILFLMFNPGPQNSLLNDIVNRASPLSPTYDEKLYVHGVLNQDPGTKAHPIVGLFERNRGYYDENFDVVMAWNLQKPFAYWDKEMRKLDGTWAMVHSKVVVIDPFGKRPVVITGSHNLGPKASSANDENLVIVEGAPELAKDYAVNIMGVFLQYRWRFRNRQPDAGTAPPKNQWAGLRDSAEWHKGLVSGARERELQFWLGAG